MNFWTVLRFEEAEHELALARAALDDDPHERIEIDLAALEVTYFRRRSDATAREALARLGPEIERDGTLGQRYRYHRQLGWHGIAAARYTFDPLAFQHSQRALEIALELGDAPTVAMARFGVAFQCLLSGGRDVDAALALFEHVERDAHAISDITLAVRAQIYLAIGARWRGDAAACKAAAARAHAHASRARIVDYVGVVHGCLAWCAVRTGQIDEAKRELARAHAVEISRFPFRWSIELTTLVLYEDDPERVRAACERILDPLQQQLEPALEAALLASLEAARGGDPAATALAANASIRIAARLGYV